MMIRLEKSTAMLSQFVYTAYQPALKHRVIPPTQIITIPIQYCIAMKLEKILLLIVPYLHVVMQDIFLPQVSLLKTSRPKVYEWPILIRMVFFLIL